MSSASSEDVATGVSEFDYVVAGAGSAGCVLAARLAEDPSLRVCLVEAGGSGRSLFIRMPAGNGFAFGNPKHDWGFESVPQAGLNGRRIYYPRGKGLGGSSIMNGMIYMRGLPADYDGWRDSGLDGWGFAELLPYFRRSQGALDRDGAWHGVDGPLRTERSRNFGTLERAFLFLFAGGLHWRLHRRRAQGDDFRMNRKQLSADSKLFLWRDQVRDNMFWSVVSGVTIWTLFEAISYWIYASGRLPIIDNPWYFIACVYLLFAWSTMNFYFVHRALHWQPIYRYVHELHHRNVDVGPWSGISMHPLEHLFYFSPFVLWWFLPVHPVIILLTGFYQGLNPALSHSGFDYVRIGRLRLKTGDWFHQLHHQYFNLNYGNTPTPFDRLFGSWHDGSGESLATQKQRIRGRRRPAS